MQREHGEVEYRDLGLGELVKFFEESKPIKIGVLSSTAAREDGDANNAEIGFLNEFGTSKIPARSWLFATFLSRGRIDEVAASIKRGFEEDIAHGREPKKVMERFGQSLVAKIQEAFDSEGFGEWEPNAPSTQDKKGRNSPLIDKGWLMKSVTYEVAQ